MEKAFNRFNNAVVLNVVEPVERFFPQFHRRIMRHIYKKHEIQTFRYKQISQHRHLKTQTPISGDSFSCLPEQKYRDGPNLPTIFLYCLRKSCCCSVIITELLQDVNRKPTSAGVVDGGWVSGGRRVLAEGTWVRGGQTGGLGWTDAKSAWLPRVDGREK